MIEKVDLSKWKKQAEIILELHREHGINITSREWRNQVKRHNKKFGDGDVKFYITHSNKRGYKATRDYSEAKEGRNDYISRGKANFENVSDCDRGFERLYNCKIDFETGEII